MLTVHKLHSAIGQLGSASRHYRVSLPWIVLRAMRLHNVQLFSLKDMLLWGLLDPAIPSEELELYVSREARTRLQVRLNDAGCNPMTGNKALFRAHCQQAGLPIPATLDVFLPPSEAEAEAHRRHWRALLDANRGRDLFCKPVIGEGGVGAYVARAQGADFEVDGVSLTADGLYRYLCDHCATGGMIVQHREQAHPVLREVTGTDALQTARIVTFLDDGGACRLMLTHFKFIVGANIVDNTHVGNLAAQVEPESGVVRAVFAVAPGVVGVQRVTEHPRTGARLVGMAIPGWQSICDTARLAAAAFPRLRVVGWDIGITAAGPVLIEGNTAWVVYPPGPMKRPVSRADWQALMGPLPVNAGAGRRREPVAALGATKPDQGAKSD